MGTREIDQLVKEFGDGIGLPDLTLDENGYCCLFFDEIGVNIELDETGERLFLYVNVGDLPSEKNPALYEMLLEANLMFSRTGGATLGIDKENALVALACTIPLLGLDKRTFERRLESFIAMAENWQGKIALCAS
jgi:hypothetical protein